eukprot:4585351-Pyramimonas_sp.AAC.1
MAKRLDSVKATSRGMEGAVQQVQQKSTVDMAIEKHKQKQMAAAGKKKNNARLFDAPGNSTQLDAYALLQAELRANQWEKAIKAGKKMRLTGSDVTDYSLTNAQKEEKKRAAWEKVRVQMTTRRREGDPGRGGLQGTRPRAQVAAGRTGLRASLRGWLG